MIGTLEERFLDKISPEPNSGCHLWTAVVDPKGYGRIKSNGVAKLAHRVAYELYVGKIPEGLELDHLCRVRSCVNPQHLEAVTHRENMRRGNSGKNESARTHCPSGHEYSEKNTYRHNGERHCRICVLAASKRYRARKKLA